MVFMFGRQVRVAAWQHAAEQIIETRHTGDSSQAAHHAHYCATYFDAATIDWKTV